MKKVFEIAVLCCLPLLAVANPTINIAVVFSNDHGLNSSQKNIWAADVQRHLSDAFSGFNYSFEIWVSPNNLSISTGNKTAVETVEWMQSNAGLKQIRNTIGGSGADLVLMIGGETLSSVCGRAGIARPPLGTMPPLAVSTHEHDHAAYAAIFIKETNCVRWDIIIPHEVGHLLYAEHQRSADNNGDINKPSRINHGISSGSNRSIMYNPTSSASIQEWSGSTGLAGNYENNKTWLNNTSMINTVAAYRPLQPASPPSTASVEWLYCNGSTASYSVTWGGVTIYPDDYFEVFRQIGTSWYPWYEGDDGCVMHSSSSSAVKFRVRIKSIGGDSDFVIFSGGHSCGGGGQPF